MANDKEKTPEQIEAQATFLELMKAEDLADEFENNGDDDNANNLRTIIRNVEKFISKHM